jgi:hypothetical protein
MSALYDKKLAADSSVHFLIHVEDGVCKITRSDQSESRLYDIVIMEEHPVVLSVAGPAEVHMERLQEVRVGDHFAWGNEPEPRIAT